MLPRSILATHLLLHLKSWFQMVGLAPYSSASRRSFAFPERSAWNGLGWSEHWTLHEPVLPRLPHPWCAKPSRPKDAPQNLLRFIGPNVWNHTYYGLIVKHKFWAFLKDSEVLRSPASRWALMWRDALRREGRSHQWPIHAPRSWAPLQRRQVLAMGAASHTCQHQVGSSSWENARWPEEQRFREDAHTLCIREQCCHDTRARITNANEEPWRGRPSRCSLGQMSADLLTVSSHCLLCRQIYLDELIHHDPFNHTTMHTRLFAFEQRRQFFFTGGTTMCTNLGSFYFKCWI
jgi:hypothetical protein